MKKSLFLLMLVVCAVLNSCKKDYLVGVVGRVTGNVKTYDNSYLEKVLVTVEGTTISDSTDASGFYELNGLSAGASTLIFTKDGYTKSRTSVSIVAPTAVANTTSGNKQSFTYSVVSNTVLYPMIGTAKGYVYYNGAPVVNAKVYAYPSSGYTMDQAYFSTTTAADGSYSFTTLPITTITSVGYNFVSYHPSLPYASGSVTTTDITTRSTVATINLSIDPLVFVSNNIVNNVVDTAASVTLTFSDNLSKTITDLKGGYVNLYNTTTAAYTVATTITYTANTINIKPVSGFTHGNTYYISYTVYSTEVKNLTGVVSTFKANARTTVLSVQPVVSTSFSAGYLSLTTVTPGATGYDIYYQTPTMSEYNSAYSSYPFSTAFSISSYATGTKFFVVPRATTDGTNYYGIASLVVTK